ncbi:hypothetical protein ACHHV8_10070 [Paenibacillus sp. TAB 01]|uniref:hypothetical protein n=1 Tax=Paenibacillus sp. TAB 01 TaxID=3368988 RepID=UPI0037532865
MASRSKVINTILNLKSNMAAQIASITNATNKQQKAMQKLTNNINKFKSNTKTAFTEAAKSAVKFGATVGAIGFTAIGATAGLALKKGLEDSMDFEGLKNQLLIATRDQTKASDLFSWANKFANTTPFGNKEVIDATSQLTMQGLDAKKWIPLLGDMAASKSGKTLDDAVQAQLDAQTGELERLKEFGITKQNIIDEGNRIMKGKQLVNNKGQITDMDNFLVALQSLMSKKYSGAMEAQSKTVKGIWDNTKATVSTALTKIWGIQEDGSIKAGSALDKLKNKAKTLMDFVDTAAGGAKLDELQADLSQVFDYAEVAIPKAITAAKTAWDKLTGALSWINDNKGWLIPTLGGIAAAIAAQKVASTIVTIYESWIVVTKALTLAQVAFAAASALTPFGIIAIAIGAAVAAAILLYTYWDKIKAKLDVFAEAAKSVLIGLVGPFGMIIEAGTLLYKNWDTIREKGTVMWATLKDAFNSSVNVIIDKINWLIEKINLIPGVNIPIIPKIDMSSYNNAAPMLTPSAIDNAIKPNSPMLAKHALGTNYAPGGPSLVGEQGPEIVNLPRGSQVLNASKTAGALGGKSVTVNISVGTLVAPDGYADKIGELLYDRISLAMTNV